MPSQRRKNIRAVKMTRRVGAYVPQSDNSGIVKSKDKAINAQFKAEVKSALKSARRSQPFKMPSNLRSK